MTVFNLNISARVTLTQAGATQLNRLCARLAGYEPVVSGHVLTCELWRLMQDFGEVIAMQLPVPFENNSLEIEPFENGETPK